MITRVAISPQKSSIMASWMVSLADLLALMLTFFVLMFSMNAVQLSTWQAVVTSFRNQFNPHAAAVTPVFEQDAQSIRQYRPWAVSLEYLSALLSYRIMATDIPWAAVVRLPDRVVLSLDVDGAFEPGSARLKPQAEDIIADLVQQFSRIGNRIVLSGHMNSGQVTGLAYQSDWETSLRRAEEVANAFRAAGYSRHLTVVGYGSGRSRELAQMVLHTPAVTATMTRRVDIEILAWSVEAAHAQ